MESLSCFLLLSLLTLTTPLRLASAQNTKPEQVAIAATESFTSIVVTWVTFNDTATSQVQYGLHARDNKTDLSQSATGYSTKFVSGGITRVVHRVTLTKLTPLSKYDYRCGSSDDWSDILTFKTLGDETFSPTIAIYGDFGLQNARSLPWLVKDVNNERFDAVIHAGDLAYDLFENDGKQGDSFMNQIQDIASQVPYMVTPGNHEWKNNFTDYRKRFSMPGGKENIMYSWTVGPVKVISFSTEVYFFLEYGIELIHWQYEWLEEQLKAANTPEERARYPWVITIGHRPMYCTTIDHIGCDHYNRVRIGEPMIQGYGLEKLFYTYGVDIEIWGHQHIYERYWPLYDYKVYNGSVDPYTDPGAPIHIVSGSAGNREDHTPFRRKQPDWVAMLSSDYGYSIMTVHNYTHISMEQISVDKDGAAIDQFTIVKNSHGPYV